ncbi:metallophosphoesterase family protein [Marinobacter orientalis]|uniref:DNA repair exonuclease n=1 Tax=Marinobacter orientalis TaxID=1928859 RepID=A0A7Y0WS47_9GAMM|nr:DNA repair exonuclease [Marinobacter orientalis]NMT63520.1 DNA repair exonuclease [Marinobacter orientalis]TGX48578.1 DNA repair exonuclease [Marinobacter orientalis]
MPRFLHTADWQMGRAFSRFETEDGAALVEARFEAIEKLARLANEHRCDAILVAGDVFDAQTVADRTIRRVFNATRGFTGPWVMLPGNHDAALAESVWTRARRLGAVPDNIHLALEPGTINLEPQGLAILCAPLTQRNTYSDLTATFNSCETPEGLVRIGLAHGSVQGLLPDEIDSTNPILPNRAETARLDYFALGDWHGTKQIDERTWYSGTPEPERFRNNGAGYALIINLSGPGELPAVTPVETARYQWHQWRQTLTVESDLDQLLERLQALPEPSVLDLRLDGSVTLAGEERLINALSVAEARFRSIQCDRSGLQLEPTDDDIAALKADGYVGEVIEHLRTQQQNDDAEAARDALAVLAGLLKERKQEISE